MSLFRLRVRKSPHASRRFGADVRAVGAVEFALTLPIVLAVLYGTVEYVRLTVWTRHISLLADTVAELVSTKTTAVTDADISFAWDSALAMVPDANYYAGIFGSTWRQVIRVRVSSVRIANGKATVDWSAGDQTMARPCGTLQIAPDDATPATQNVAQSVLVVSSAIVADVQAVYQPLLGTDWIPNITSRRTAYFVPRTVSIVTYSPSGSNSLGYVCP